MPSHQERIRAKNPEMNCNHLWLVKSDSSVAPYILANGDRLTIIYCISCGIKEEHIRSQEQFLVELKNRRMNSVN